MSACPLPVTAWKRPPRSSRSRWTLWPLWPLWLLWPLGLMLCTGLAAAQVGMSQISVGSLPVTLVYPTAQPSREVTRGTFRLDVALDAEPAPGRHRLVVLSHGSGGSALSDHALAATLARAGFVVAQPLHAGDNHLDTTKAGPDSWITRPQEVRQVIDALAVHAQWQPRLQLDRVGVHGMSAGGVTALSLAGAQWRLLNLVRHCLDQTEADFGFCFNGVADPARQAARKAEFERARGVPEMFLPARLKALHGGSDSPDARPDPRVAAVTLAVPVAAIFSGESLARVAIPVGLVTAGRDTMLVPRFHSGHVLAHCRRCSALADLPAAAHLDLLAPWPQAVAREVAARQSRGGELSPDFDPRERTAAFEKIAAFFRRHLGP